MKSLKKLIEEGNFASVSYQITSRHYPMVRKVADIEDMSLMSLYDLGGKDITQKEVDKAIKNKGYRHATIVELLIYAKDKWNGKNTILAFGAPWMQGTHQNVPYIFTYHAGRGLDLSWTGPDYTTRHPRLIRFLVVKK